MKFATGPLVELGYISKPHGYDGWVRVELVNDIEFNTTEPLFLMFNQKPVPFFIEQKKGSNPTFVKLQFVHSIDEAQSICGTKVYIESDFDASFEEHSILGYLIIDEQAGEIGPIEEIIENPGQDLLQTTYQNNSCLIPFVDAFVLDIDHTNQTVYVKLPDGLLDMAD